MKSLAASLLLVFGNALASPGDLVAEVAAGRHAGIDAVAVAQSGQTIASGTRPGLELDDVDIRSATKSVTALLVGIAIDRGLIASVDVPVATLLPDLVEGGSDPRRREIRIRDLLTMRSGLDCNDWDPASPGHEDTMYAQRDWLAFWSTVPMRDAPGETFSYCTGNVIALGRLLTQATGQSVPAFARAVLFEPLGIREARWASWNDGKDTDTGGHLAVQPDALLALGQLVLNNGRWNGRQLVSEAWIRAMTTARTDIPGRAQRYGYLWWIDETRQPHLPRTRLFMAWGNGGNFVVVMPELSAVFVSVGRRYNQPEALEPLRWLRDRVLPVLGASPDVQPP